MRIGAAIGDFDSTSGCWFVVALARTRPAQHLAGTKDFSAEVDSFTALFADHALAFVSRKFLRRQFDRHPLGGEQIFVGNFAIGEHLLLVLVGNFWMQLASHGL
jgi:hypothetical protein